MTTYRSLTENTRIYAEISFLANSHALAILDDAPNALYMVDDFGKVVPVGTRTVEKYRIWRDISIAAASLSKEYLAKTIP